MTNKISPVKRGKEIEAEAIKGGIRERLLATFDYDPETGFLTRKASKYKRHIGTIAGRTTSTGHVQVLFEGRWWLAHRIIWCMAYGNFPESYLDHRNHKRNDNRLENLRDCSPRQNHQNRRKQSVKSTSQYKGVHWNSCDLRWRAVITVNGVVNYLGQYRDETKAALAYDEAARKFYGEFACINFPNANDNLSPANK